MRHDVLTSPRLQELKKKRRKNFRNRIIFLISIIVVVFLVFVFLSKIPVLNIKGMLVTGNKVIDTEDIGDVVDSNLAGHYLYFIPKTNIFLYPKNRIRENLASDFKRLKDINVNLNSDGILEISVSEREGAYIWCGVDLPVNKTEEECLFLDKEGYIFDKAPYFSGDVYFKFYGSLFETYNPIFTELLNFKENLEQMGLKPVALLAEENQDAKIFLKDASSVNPNAEIIFKIDTDLSKSAENLQAALDTEPLKTDIQKKYSSLEYIDLRYGNKVYYRFR